MPRMNKATLPWEKGSHWGPPRLGYVSLFSLASPLSLVFLTLLVCFPAHAGITVNVNGPGGNLSQTLPDAGGSFAVDIPLNKNMVNAITVSASDTHGNTATHQMSITQVSLDNVVISEFTSEPLSPERIEQLVNDGVIDLADPENYNVSEFTIVLTIQDRTVPISVPIATPINNQDVTGYENLRLPFGPDSGGGPPKVENEIIVFEEYLATEPGKPEPPPIPGVFIIEGRIKSLKEFYSCRLLLMNASGIFTLSNVVAELEFPDGGLTNILPADGIVSFGDILPGDNGQPGQVEKEFIIRGDQIGTRGVRVNFGGTVTGPGIPEEEAIPFNGSAQTTVEVKGPPTFQVEVFHPSRVVKDEPYDLRVNITNTGEVPALYASLELDVAGDGEILDCDYDGAKQAADCQPVEGPVVRSFGHIWPGKTVSEVFTINPLRTGAISSCTAIADQNIGLQVYVGNIGCMVGQYPPDQNVPDGIPSVTVVPAPNATNLGLDAPVAAFFSELVDEATVTTGQGGSFNVYGADDQVLPGTIRFDTMGEGTDRERTVAIWQFEDGITNRLPANKEFTVIITPGVKDLDGNALFNEWISTFGTTGEGVNDDDPPTITLSVQPPVLPSFILPGQIVRLNAYTADQGSGVMRVEARMKDLNDPEANYQLIDQKRVLLGDEPPFIFSIDSANLALGHSYEIRGTAYDYMGNSQDTTIAITVADSADPPTITLPDDPALPVLQGISVPLTPKAYTGGVREVRFYLDGAVDPFQTVTLPPYQAHARTLPLALGEHRVRAVAIDGLNQTGEDTLTFSLVENKNMPVVGFGTAVDGSQYIQGSSFVVDISVDDPVGIASVQAFLDSAKGDPITHGTQPFVINTANLELGDHKITVVATNLLGVSNDPNDPASVFEFSVVEPPPGQPPAAPTVSEVSYPENGRVTFRGTSVPGARIDVTNTNLSAFVQVYANGAGAFSGTIDADAGQELRFVAYDFTQSPDPSEPTLVTVQAAPVLDHIEVTPSTITFTNFSSSQQLTVTGHYQSGATANLTSRAQFSSSALGVAGVSASGQVAPISNGSATITVTVEGKTAEVQVTVNVVVLTHITVEPMPVVLEAVAQTQPLVVTAHYSDGSTQVKTSGISYLSANSNIASVNSNGIVTAMGKGTTQITVYLPGADPVTVPVSVNTGQDPVPTTQILSPAQGSFVEPGETVNVSVRAEDSLGGVVKVHLNVTGATTYSTVRQIAPPALSTTQSIGFQVSDAAPIGGSIIVSAYAEDTSGGLSSITQVALTVGDKTAPSANITAPAPLTEYNYGDTITIAVTATDAVGVSLIRYELTGAFERTGSKAVSPAATQASATFNVAVPYGLTYPDLRIKAFARDAAGYEGASVPVDVRITDADITPPETEATGITLTGNAAERTITYKILNGLEDLDHVELYFRRDEVGTFNRFTRPGDGNPLGEFIPQSGALGWVTFDSTRMGGDGHFEFYTVGVDKAGNREPAPDDGAKTVIADQETDISAGTVWSIINTDTTIDTGDTTYDNRNVRIDAATVTVLGHHAFHNVELLNGGVLTHSQTDLTNEFGLDISVWSLTVNLSCSVDVTARGYLGGRHEGAGDAGRTLGNAEGSTFRSAGSYGGTGGAQEGTPNAIYGNLVMPGDLGSGGSRGYYGEQGGDGGGRVQVQAINVISDGAILANGDAGKGSHAGGGSGGAIYLVTNTLSGTGVVSANGGGNQLGGGGGRVAVHYTDISTMDTSLIQALGGPGSRTGGNGTVFLKGVEEGNGTLVIDGQGETTSFTALPIPPGYVFDNIIIRNNARVVVDDPLEITGTLSVLTGSILTHSTSSESGLQIEADHVVVDETSSIDVSARGYRGGRRDGNGADYGLTLGDAPGAQFRSAGSYGGYGGVQDGTGSNLPYGHPSQPVYLGSGGSRGYYGEAGGNGGGLLHIVARKSLEVDGSLLAIGGTGDGSSAGGGSGGSIHVQTSFIKGTGVISANGGGNQVGGGGGRVAIEYDYVGVSGDDFSGLRNITAFSGRGSSRAGSAGTVLLHRSDQTLGDLYVDDNMADGGVPNETASIYTPLVPISFGAVQALTADTLTMDGLVSVIPDGLVGIEINPNINQTQTYMIVSNTVDTVTVDTSGKPALTSVASAGNTYAGVYRFDNVFFRRGGFLVTADRLVVNDTLQIDEYGKLTHYDAAINKEFRLDLTIEHLVVSSTGSIDLNARGYLGGNHNGAGDSGRTLGNLDGSTFRSAGSYGGLGATQEGTPNAIYGSLTDPAALGSGGSRGYYGERGGDGGGWVAVHAGDIVLDGLITAVGAVGEGSHAGGGSGGTINIMAGSLSGAGVIRVNGGGSQIGGGGGRIAVHCDSFLFDEAHVEALGGPGSSMSGGNGTVIIKRAGQTWGDLVIDGMGVDTPHATSTIPDGYTFDNIILRNKAQVLADHPIVVIDSFQLLTGSVLTHTLSSEAGLEIQAGEVVVDADSSIDVSRKGYRGGKRDGNNNDYGFTLGGVPGAAFRSGGSYGGFGHVVDGSGSNPPYGSPLEAFYLGSGGSRGYYGEAGGHGGGFVHILAEDVLVDGAIRAEGGTGNGSSAGGGSGGSIWIETGDLSGSGTVSVNGGGNQAGGGGGRIVVNYETLGNNGNDFNGLLDVTAFGGSGSNGPGSSGTVLMVQAGQSAGDLYIDGNSTEATASVPSTLPLVGFAPIVDLTADTLVTNGVVRMVPNGLVGIELNPNVEQDETFTIVSNTDTTITVDTAGKAPLTSVAAIGDTYAAVYSFDNVYFRRGGYLLIGDQLRVTDSLLLQERALLSHFDATTAYESRLDVEAGFVQVSADSRVNVDARGYLGGNHNGTGDSGRTLGNVDGSTFRSAGSYGGLGGSQGGTPNDVYGYPSEPAALGSGGSRGYYNERGGDGGGWIRVVAGDLVLDGEISADGEQGYGSGAGSGSGGTVNLTVGSLTGAGSISADGYAYQNGGGGGRIAVYYGTMALDQSHLQVLGGQGSVSSGGSGTLFLKAASQQNGTLVIDGQTAPGFTPLRMPEGFSPDEIYIRNNSRVMVDRPLDVQRMTLEGNSQLLADEPMIVRDRMELVSGCVLTHSLGLEAGLRINAQTFVIDATSSIDVSGKGYRGARQSGNDNEYGLTDGGQPGAQTECGGSYGGNGGNYAGYAINEVYGDPGQPSKLGSGGGRGVYNEAGGNGGGFVDITADSFELNGSILANGTAGGGSQAGSGSGGSIRIVTKTLDGSGTIAADGGAHQVGGGGGRIAVYYTTLGMAQSQIRALGGQGNSRTGGHGTTYLKASTQAVGTLYVDGQDNASGVTPLRVPTSAFSQGTVIAQNNAYVLVDQTLSTKAFTIRGNALVLADKKLTLSGTLNLQTGGTLSHSNSVEDGVQIEANNVVVDAESKIDVSGKGYRGARQPGNDNEIGLTLGGLPGAPMGSGGSYAGTGGVRYSSAGLLYGTPDTPLYLGSGGGRGYYNEAGGNGGGRIDIVSHGTVQVDGAILADGTSGNGSSAGSGSGGSIRIDTPVFQGAGTLHANGGVHQVGGGGGRIMAIYTTLGTGENDFDDLRAITAFGGQASDRLASSGTVLLRQRSQEFGDLHIDGGMTDATASAYTQMPFVGAATIAELTTDTVTTDGSIPMLPNGLVGVEINPNVNQGQIYVITANTDTTITVDRTGKPALTSVATVGDTLVGVHRFENVYFRRGGVLVMGDDKLLASGEMVIDDYGMLTHYNATTTYETYLDLTVGTLEITPTGSINVDGLGYLGGFRGDNSSEFGRTYGNALGSTRYSGGSFGGLGGSYNSGVANTTYGTASAPAALGSGGAGGGYGEAGGDGGGHVSIWAGEAYINGLITAGGLNGNGTYAGSGSGGTIYIMSPRVQGTGTIRANGGEYQVGGGGGRVAVLYNNSQSNLSGLGITASGGSGSTSSGQNGTVQLTPGTVQPPF